MAIPVSELHPALPGPLTARSLYKVGTLRYTAFGLLLVFFWVLWGDFIYMLLDTSLVTIFPKKLNEMGAGDFTVQMLHQTLARTVAFGLAPIISFRSDRYRSPRGRRIPFILWTTPLVGLFLVLIGCTDNLTAAVTRGADAITVLGYSISTQTIGIALLGVLLFCFDFANMFVGTVYYYMFNDVVPQQFLSRFLSCYRMVSSLAGMLYSAYIFPHALTHFRLIFVLAGVGYTVGLVTMCLFVKEGSYGPPPQNLDRRTGFISSAKTFAKECFTHKFYWYFFLASTFRCLALSITPAFVLLRDLNSLGMGLAELGSVFAWTQFVSLLLQYPSGWLADRLNPIRVHTATSFISLLSPLAACVWLFRDFGTAGNLHYYYWISLLFLPIGALCTAAELPMYMRLLPRERYGQFCSANAMLRSFAMVVGSVLLGVLMKVLADGVHMGPWRYRYVALWALAFQIPSSLFLWLLYREWKARGGEKGYTPPGVT